MKLLIHIKLNNGEAHEVVSNDVMFGYGCIHIFDHELLFNFSDIKELIIKPLVTDTAH